MVMGGVVKAEKHPPLVKEGMPESGPNKLSEFASRAEPETEDPFNTDEGCLDPVSQTPLPAELVASEEHLPLLHVAVLLRVVPVLMMINSKYGLIQGRHLHLLAS